MDKHYADTVRLLLNIAPDVFDNDIFAMKGGTAINLFLRDMPRLSVDIDVVYLPWQTPRDEALQAINQELAAIAQRVEPLGVQTRLIRSKDDHGHFVVLSSAFPSRLLSAFPEGTPIRRISLEEALQRVAAHASGESDHEGENARPLF